MRYFPDYSPRLLLGGIFLLMLTLAVIINITGNDIVRQTLVILIPLGGVSFGAVSASEAESNLKLIFSIILILSGCTATFRAVIGGVPFSNVIVAVAVTGSIAGIVSIDIFKPLYGLLND